MNWLTTDSIPFPDIDFLHTFLSHSNSTPDVRTFFEWIHHQIITRIRFQRAELVWI